MGTRKIKNTPSRIGSVLRLLIVEAFVFLIAALVHFGLLMHGYEHARAGIAEGVIAAVLAIGVLGGFFYPGWKRAVALSVQAFALLGTLLGALMIAIGVGPQTIPDRLYHGFLFVLLIGGARVILRKNSRDNGMDTSHSPQNGSTSK